METMSESPMTSIDRFSGLPDDIAHKVVSYLKTEDISRLSAVSKRCRQLCISSPVLNFEVVPYQTNARKRAQLMNYVERLLALRIGMDTQECRIRWCLESSFNFADEEYRLLSWLHHAVKCDFKRLFLDNNLKCGSDFVLPSSLFCSKSLEILKMRFHNGVAVLKTPSSIGNTHGFSSLKCLRMQSVRIHDRFGEFISSCCKFLEELSLTEIKGTESITITSSSLKVLYISFGFDLLHLHISAEKLVHMGLFWVFHSPIDCKLQLSAPNLEHFAYVIEHSTAPKTSIDKNLVRALHDVAGNIKGLILTDDYMQEDNRAFGRQESQDVLILQNLKFATIEFTGHGKNQLELIKFILKTAKDLQNMTVLYASPLRSRVRNVIIQYKKASSNVKLTFLPLQVPLHFP
ncbi:hypothetical protein TIFTF001_042780 [Ficus carica]|uniref:F-box domain-containing protein n=1 Tax=Ficus carica TaxID=3494 RepID=A0AA87YVU0_FICCA|nr:hypothetical protein TIFTF001_042780 [Ficus carica]